MLFELDIKYHNLFREIIKKTIWKKEEFKIITQKYNFMPNSVIDSINEWSDETLGDYLLIEDSSIEVVIELLEEY